jgi:hypothetical protein
MTTTIDFKDWLNEQHIRLAYEYRLSLSREIMHVKRIYNVITPDVRIFLIQSLKEIQHPTMQHWGGERTGTMEIYNKAVKPDFNSMLKEAIERI